MNACMYVYMYTCIYVCMYVGMYLCMYVRMYVCMYNNNNSNFFYLQVANSPSKPGFKANLSERIIREQIAV